MSPTRKRSGVLALVVIATVTLSASGGRSTPIPGLLTAPAHAAGGSEGFSARLNEDRWLAVFDVPGVAVALVRDGKLTWSKGYGKADKRSGQAVTADTVFQVGSISKSVTAWGVMRLVQEGKLSLDAPVERYLTRWHLPRSSFDADGVTIGRLLKHTAGLNSQDYSPIAQRPLPSLEQSLAGESGGMGARTGTDDVRIIMQPGQQQSYSNGGYTLLQLAVEEVTGEPFARYMQRAVLTPLGMTHSSFTYQEHLRAQTATGHNVSGDAVPRSAFTEKAAGGLQTTANDLAIFVSAAIKGPSGEPAGRGVLTPKNVAALFARESIPDGSTTSLGYEVQTLPDGTHAAGHGGKNVGWRAEFLILPDRREGLVVLTNSERLDGILGFTEQAWGDWLGTGAPMTSRMEQSTLGSFYGLILAIAGVFLLAACICAAFVLRRSCGVRRQWAWHGSGSRSAWSWALRAVALVASIAAAIFWATHPMRQEYASITPTRVALLTIALALLCVVVAITALTRPGDADATAAGALS